MKKILLSFTVIFLLSMTGMAQDKVANKKTTPPESNQPSLPKSDESKVRYAEKLKNHEALKAKKALKASERNSTNISKGIIEN